MRPSRVVDILERAPRKQVRVRATSASSRTGAGTQADRFSNSASWSAGG
jgi:hypothetical protein